MADSESAVKRDGEVGRARAEGTPPAARLRARSTARTRVGRGEASKGKTAGRGTKGSKARANGAGPASRAARCR